MATDLLRNLQGIQVVQPIVVTSFVHLDSTLQSTNTLGIQLAKHFINDLLQIGLPVAEFTQSVFPNTNILASQDDSIKDTKCRSTYATSAYRIRVFI
jgi:hypothetical protein